MGQEIEHNEYNELTLKKSIFINQNNIFFSLTIIPFIGFIGLEEEMNMCEELHRKEEMRLWTVMATLHGCTHASAPFRFCRRVDRGVLDLKRSLTVVAVA